jgi:glycosyltransferase involved in cell wall biosynthesis
MNNYKKRTEYKSTTPLVDRAFRHLSKLPILSTINTWSKEYPGLRQVPLTLVDAMAPSVVKNKITKDLDRIWSDASRLRPLLYETPNRLSTWQRVQQAALVLLLSVPDLFYRRAFNRLDRSLNRLTMEAGLSRCNRTGITMMIGSLSGGGAERQTMLTARATTARGLGPVSLACAYLDTPEQRFLLPGLDGSGVSVTHIGSDPIDVVDRPIEELVRTLPRRLSPVLVYAASLAARHPRIAHLWLDDVNIKGGIAAVLTGVPRIVLSQRNIPPQHFQFHEPYMREAYRWLARQPGVVMINNSATGAEAYESWLSLPPGTIRIVRNGLDCAEETLRSYREGRGRYRAVLGVPPDAPLIGGVLRFSEEKRPLLWLKVAAAVRKRIPEAHFVLIGDGVLRGEVTERARRSDLADAMHLPGMERDCLRAMADMDLLLLTSRAEGLPNVLVEAQAVGTPVVTTRVGGAPECVRHGLTGWILTAEDPDLIAQTVVELLHDHEWRKKARAKGPEFVRNSFNLDRVIEETIALYQVD